MGGVPATAPRARNAAQIESATYRLAALDPEFLLSDHMRGVRFLLEFEKAEESLKAARIASTIVVFGSAATPSQDRRYRLAQSFAELVSRRGGALAPAGQPRQNVIATGGGGGIMEAANRGAWDARAPSVGFNISLPTAQEPNAYVTPALCFNFHYFAMRKMHFMMRAAALVVFPGGFGTLDELFEVLTLRQTNKAPPIPVILVDQAYWRSIINLEGLVAAGMVRPDDLELIRFADSPETIWSGLIAGGVAPYAAPAWRRAVSPHAHDAP
ncbi:LOG family protein [Phenylobacterium immobile]|uniref:LOG family protein n=1 Tax=Phenylobacterium immobile TaxID=21 RepID=UPI000A695C4F|nr:LOG family protein [Phenylobacterium immobile]